ncbi:hypothetical protein RI367_002553 [Sorochytrium milnesiophthora]
MASAPTTVVFGSDHAGFALKDQLVKYVKEKYPKITVNDVGAHSEDRVDYPKYGQKVGELVSKDINDPLPSTLGIAVCGTGIGISIAANKVSGVRCALCHDHYTGLMARQHNNANVLALGGRVVGVEVAKEVVDVFLTTRFLGQQHATRIGMLESNGTTHVE